MEFIDTHCHVHFNAYKEDMDEVIRRTLAKGVVMVTVGTQSTTSANGLAVAEKYEGMYATVGLHPNHLCEQEFFDEQEEEGTQRAAEGPEVRRGEGVAIPAFRRVKTRCEAFDYGYYLRLTKHPKCVAIGECGLDYYRLPENVDRDEVIAKQKVTVREHFELATEACLPVVIHCRDAHADQLQIISEFVAAGKLPRRGVVHCFTGTLEEANAYVDLGFLISFTGVITFPARKADKPPPNLPLEGGGNPSFTPLSSLQHVVRTLPLEHMMIETDAPYLTPVPHRGERNEPWMVEFVAAKVAELKGIPVEEVARVTTENARRLFGIGG